MMAAGCKPVPENKDNSGVRTYYPLQSNNTSSTSLKAWQSHREANTSVADMNSVLVRMRRQQEILAATALSRSGLVARVRSIVNEGNFTKIANEFSLIQRMGAGPFADVCLELATNALRCATNAIDHAKAVSMVMAACSTYFDSRPDDTSVTNLPDHAFALMLASNSPESSAERLEWHNAFSLYSGHVMYRGDMDKVLMSLNEYIDKTAHIDSDIRLETYHAMAQRMAYDASIVYKISKDNLMLLKRCAEEVDDNWMPEAYRKMPVNYDFGERRLKPLLRAAIAKHEPVVRNKSNSSFQQ